MSEFPSAFMRSALEPASAVRRTVNDHRTIGTHGYVGLERLGFG
jgi:hypothetical protein